MKELFDGSSDPTAGEASTSLPSPSSAGAIGEVSQEPMYEEPPPPYPGPPKNMPVASASTSAMSPTIKPAPFLPKRASTFPTLPTSTSPAISAPTSAAASPVIPSRSLPTAQDKPKRALPVKAAQVIARKPTLPSISSPSTPVSAGPETPGSAKITPKPWQQGRAETITYANRLDPNSQRLSTKARITQQALNPKNPKQFGEMTNKTKYAMLRPSLVRKKNEAESPASTSVGDGSKPTSPMSQRPVLSVQTTGLTTEVPSTGLSTQGSPPIPASADSVASIPLVDQASVALEQTIQDREEREVEELAADFSVDVDGVPSPEVQTGPKIRDLSAQSGVARPHSQPVYRTLPNRDLVMSPTTHDYDDIDMGQPMDQDPGLDSDEHVSSLRFLEHFVTFVQGISENRSRSSY
jgi:hypothetical protein